MISLLTFDKEVLGGAALQMLVDWIDLDAEIAHLQIDVEKIPEKSN